MKTARHLKALIVIIGLGVVLPVMATEKPKLVPREDYVVSPAVGDGLCVHNLFQSNMVIQRDKHNRPKCDKKKFVLTSPHVPNPIHYRFAWGRNPLASVMGFPSRVPLPTQRSDDWSDDWSDEDLYQHYFCKAPANPNGLSRAETGELRRFLIKQDLTRRLKEAQMLLDKHKE